MPAWIRDIFEHGHDAESQPTDGGGRLVTVPGFGYMAVVPKGHDWWAALFQPPSTEPHLRVVTVVEEADGNHLEIEVLPNTSGEDRIVVCIDVADFDGR